MLCAVAVSVMPPPAGAADTPRLDRTASTRSILPGGKVTVTVRARGADRCQLRAGRARKTVRLQGAAAVRFRFRLARAIKPGRYPLTVVCDDRRVRHTLQVRKTRRPSSRVPATIIKGRITAARVGRPSTGPAPFEPDVEPESLNPATSSCSRERTRTRTCR